MNKNTIKAIKQVQSERMELSIRKHHDYSTAVDNIALCGINGIAVRLFDKACRLMSLAVNVDVKRAVVDETIEDTLKDLANYADYGNVLLRGQWEK